MGADLWEARADERERLADERERLADERDALADRHDHTLDRRALADDGDSPDRVEAMERLRRAEADVQRAQANLLRAQRAVARADARASSHAAAELRVAATTAAQDDADEELAWLIDRRDFVAAERETIAQARDREADVLNRKLTEVAEHLAETGELPR